MTEAQGTVLIAQMEAIKVQFETWNPVLLCLLWLHVMLVIAAIAKLFKD